MLAQIGRFLKKVRSRKGYTLVEAATVVAITGAMAIVSVPIASDKIEDGKIATASGTASAIATAMVKFFGDTANFPLAATDLDGDPRGVSNGVITTKIKVLRSGVNEVDNNLDPDLETDASVADTANLALWTPGTAEGPNPRSAIGTDNTKDINLNNHLVTDAVRYGQGGLNWLGPYIPSVDQDPWGRNYFAYVRAIDFDSFGPTQASGNVKVPLQTPGSVFNSSTNKRIFCWIISGGADEKLQTAPTDSIIRGDDIGTILALPAQVTGTNDKGQTSR